MSAEPGPGMRTPTTGIGRQLIDEPPDQRGKRLLAATKAGDDRIEHRLGIDPLQRKRMSGLIGEHYYKR